MKKMNQMMAVIALMAVVFGSLDVVCAASDVLEVLQDIDRSKYDDAMKVKLTQKEIMGARSEWHYTIIQSVLRPFAVYPPPKYQKASNAEQKKIDQVIMYFLNKLKPKQQRGLLSVKGLFKGDTALMMAARGGLEKTAELLKKFGAWDYVLEKDKYGVRASGYAQEGSALKQTLEKWEKEVEDLKKEFGEQEKKGST